jgi:hypothetical protein
MKIQIIFGSPFHHTVIARAEVYTLFTGKVTDCISLHVWLFSFKKMTGDYKFCFIPTQPVVVVAKRAAN